MVQHVTAHRLGGISEEYVRLAHDLVGDQDQGIVQVAEFMIV